jgi:hypothetical protein
MVVMARTSVSQEIRESLRLLPVSWILHNALPGSISFEEWFRLTDAERRARLTAVGELSPELRRESSELMNYEAQQAPFAYILMAPINAVALRLDLRRRVLVLRLFVAIASALFLFFAADLLLGALGVGGFFRSTALACIFESQMLWASAAHIGNDWLAIPLGTLFIGLLVLAARDGRRKYVLLSAAVLALGLLTKAYFLAFVPVFAAFLAAGFFARRMPGRTALLAACIVVLGAAPWYVRNLVLYGSLSGTQETIAGVGFRSAAAAFFHINWLSSTINLFRWALWTGNWSFVSFSRVTLNVELTLLGAALILFFAWPRQISAGEWWVLLASVVFFLGLVYQTCVTWVATHGQARNAEPWYMQCILPCLWALVVVSLERRGTAGRILGAGLVLIAAWIAAATYVFKLIPLYGGFSGRATAGAIYLWWRNFPAETVSQTMPAPLILLFVSLGVVLLSLAWLNIMLLRGFVAGRPRSD